ncbi:MAG: DnaJ domain-containing protein [Candidatus Nitrosotenuis sp.]
MTKLGLFVLVLVVIPMLAHGQQPTILEKPQRGSDEISEYYNPDDVKLAMVGIAIAVVILFLYLARDVILRRKSEYEKREYESKKNRDYEKYHSEWNTEDEDFFGEKKKPKESQEFRKMMQESNLPNYYSILGIPNDASQDEIKTKFRQLAKEHHPDRTKDEKSAERFAEINKAYEILSDDETRTEYDKYFKASFG